MTARLPIESNRTEGSQALANSGWRLRVALTKSARCRAMTAICAQRTAGVGRVEVWRGGVRASMSFPPLSSGGALVAQP
jgi:hypothetical protein